MLNQKLHLGLTFIFVLFFVGGCSEAFPSANTTATKSIDPISPTNTNTPVSLIETPSSTLSPDDSFARLQDLLKDNGGCRLPCWWGIVPGTTTWKEAESFLSTFNDLGDAGGSDDFFAVEAHLRLPREKGTLSHTYYIKNNVVVGITAYVFDWSPFLFLSKILTEYGPPDEIFIRTFRNSENGSQPYQIDLFYAELGILLEYSGGDLNTIDEKLVNCFEDLYSPFVYIWSPDKPITSTEAIDTYLNIEAMPYPIPLEDATGMDVITFYEAFRNAENPACLETPRDIWPTQ